MVMVLFSQSHWKDCQDFETFANVRPDGHVWRGRRFGLSSPLAGDTRFSRSPGEFCRRRTVLSLLLGDVSRRDEVGDEVGVIEKSEVL